MKTFAAPGSELEVRRVSTVWSDPLRGTTTRLRVIISAGGAISFQVQKKNQKNAPKSPPQEHFCLKNEHQ